MITKKTIIKGAFCDACGAILSSEGQQNSDGSPCAAHHGKLVNHFGYGSDLDGLGDPQIDLDLCEACYRKCFEALGLSRNPHIGQLHVSIERERIEGTDEFYCIRGWKCTACGWEDFSRGLKIPNHVCNKEGKDDQGRGQVG